MWLLTYDATGKKNILLVSILINKEIVFKWSFYLKPENNICTRMNMTLEAIFKNLLMQKMEELQSINILLIKLET
jgi:hypothetical protein